MEDSIALNNVQWLKHIVIVVCVHYVVQGEHLPVGFRLQHTGPKIGILVREAISYNSLLTLFFFFLSDIEQHYIHQEHFLPFLQEGGDMLF